MNEREKKKLNEKNEKFLLELAKDPKNAFCADCKTKGPRWASTNIGVFLCMPCAGLHRKMGTHISKVKSLTLDSWTEEQVQHFSQWGNEKANAFYNPNPEQHPIPVGESEMEQFIRDKYERKLFQGGRSKPASQPVENRERQDLTRRQGNNDQRGLNYESVASLNTLREMGWTDEQRNRDVLARVHGDVNQAIEVLCALPPSTQNQRRSSSDPRMMQLQALGFADPAKNALAIEKAGGNMERAIEYLVDERRKSTIAGAQQPRQQYSQAANDALFDSPDASAKLAPPGGKQQNNQSSGNQNQTQQQQAPKQQAPASDLDLLGDVFGASSQAAQAPNKSNNKDSIMSLFGSNGLQAGGQTFGQFNQQQAFGQQSQPYGQQSQQNQPFGQQNQPFGQQNQPFGQQNQPFGQQNQPFGQQNQPFGQQNQSFGQQSQPFGQQNQPFGQQSQPFGQQQQPFGQNQAFGQGQGFANAQNNQPSQAQQSYQSQPQQQFQPQQQYQFQQQLQPQQQQKSQSAQNQQNQQFLQPQQQVSQQQHQFNPFQQQAAQNNAAEDGGVFGQLGGNGGAFRSVQLQQPQGLNHFQTVAGSSNPFGAQSGGQAQQQNASQIPRQMTSSPFAQQQFGNQSQGQQSLQPQQATGRSNDAFAGLSPFANQASGLVGNGGAKAAPKSNNLNPFA